HDPLTELANRTLVLDSLAEALSGAGGSLKEAFTDWAHKARREQRRDSRDQGRDSRDWRRHSGCSASKHASSGFDHASAVTGVVRCLPGSRWGW
ncbi:hypothetical protein, partial [Amycolatopsis japonica]|uniref:hypothetical protein n=1 Tax=Amycolatopsis japonica TaxID=208439 RepID=UPI0033DF541D